MNAPADPEALRALIATLRAGRGYLHKTDIAAAAGALARSSSRVASRKRLKGSSRG